MDNDNSPSSESEVSNLDSNVARDPDGGPTYVTICDNIAERNSRMYNAPMEKGKWRNMRRYSNKRNRTMEGAEMYNWEMSLEELAAIQAENRKNREWEMELEKKKKEWELEFEKKRQGVSRQERQGASRQNAPLCSS
jgi:hypothetical protein